MTTTTFRTAALALVAIGAGLATSSAFAQDAFAPAEQTAVSARSYAAEEGIVVPPNVAGQYTCTFNEPHDRLERKACGGIHYRY